MSNTKPKPIITALILSFNREIYIWLHLRKERFSSRRKSKLMARGEGPYKLVQNVANNAYKIEFSGDMNISITFNVGGFTPYIEDEEEGHEDLSTNPLQGRREVDAEQVKQDNLLNHIKALV